MIGMRVGFEQPADGQPFSFRRFEHGVGRLVIDRSADGIEAEDGVNDRALARAVVADQIADAVRGLVEECLDERRGADAVPYPCPAHGLVGGLPVGCIRRAGELSGTPRVHRRQFFVTAADIRAAFARKLQPDRMVTVVVGGKATL